MAKPGERVFIAKPGEEFYVAKPGETVYIGNPSDKVFIGQQGKEGYKKSGQENIYIKETTVINKTTMKGGEREEAEKDRDPNRFLNDELDFEK